MIEKRLADRIFSKIRVGGLEVRYWDGEVKRYGPEKPWLTLTINRPKAVRALLRSSTLGFGESYMRGDIDVEGPITDVGRLVAVNEQALSGLLVNRLPHLRNRNRKATQAQQVQHHYDLGNDFYSLWLDESMTYSCAYFKTSADSLELAQKQKVEHILRKLQLRKGQRLLDIGSGWGELLIRAVQEYGVVGHGITLSKEQLKHSRQKVRALGLEKRLTFELINYQDLAGKPLSYDRIVSVGMYEHVGRGNHDAYFAAIDKLLIDGGISVLHTITNEVETPSDAWIDKYIFPGGYIPSIRETVRRLPEYNLRLIDYENLRIHYAMTTEEWLRRFEARREEVLEMYDERFYRMWRLYLGGSASGFRYGDLSLSQLVFTKGLNNDLPLTREFLYS